jgi:hypothetical protein
MEVDGLQIEGEFSEFAFLVFDSRSGTPSIEWREAALPGASFDLPPTCLAVVFRSGSGRLLEVGFGEDLWRWHAELDPETRTDFKLCFRSGGVDLNRVPGIWETPRDSARTWRLKWYFAWSGEGEGKAISLPGKAEVRPFSFDRGANPTTADAFRFASVPHQASILWRNESGLVPCWKAPMTDRTLKGWIRGRSEAGKPTILGDVAFHVCDCAAHLERPAKKTLTHWDLPAMLAFHAWANRQLQSQSGKFHICSAVGDKVCASLPSFFGMRG